jgi:hypothetical protein
MTILHKDEHFSCRCSILSEILHPMEVKRILNKEKSVADDFLEKRLQVAERPEDMGGERDRPACPFSCPQKEKRYGSE